jgi:MFS family permease
MIKKSSKIFFGWWMVIIPGIMTGLGAGVYGSGGSILFKPIATDLQLGRAATSLAQAIGRLEGGLEAPLTGWLSDKYGPKWVVIAGLVLFACGLVFMNYVTEPWHYYVAWGVLVGIGYNLALTIALDKVLVTWFVKRRGMALGIRFTVIGICQVAVVPVLTWLVVTYGWRTTCLVWAVIALFCVPIAVLIIKQGRPEQYGLLPDGVSPGTEKEYDKDILTQKGTEYAEGFQEKEFTLRQAMKTQAYWLTCLAWAVNTLVAGGFGIHVVPFLTDIGISQTAAGGMLSVMVFFTIPSRFVAGWLADRLPSDRMQFIAAAAFFLQGAGIAAFLIHPSVSMAWVLLILYGFGNGAPTPVRLTMGGRFFGRKSFASILGSTMLVIAPVSMVSPVYAGWIYDRTGSYDIAFLTFAVLLGVSVILVSLVRPPKLPESAR